MFKRLAAIALLTLACGAAAPVTPSQTAPPQPTPTTAPATSPPAMPTATPPATPLPTESAPPELIFQVFSLLAVADGPTAPSEFTVDGQVRIVQIHTYHWNSGQGREPGTISLESSDGATYGPWQAYGRDGMGGVTNGYWVVDIDQLLPPGTYRVVDSDPSTWAYAGDTAGRGITDVYGYR